MRYILEVDTENLDELIRALATSKQSTVVDFRPKTGPEPKTDRPYNGPRRYDATDENGLRGDYPRAIAELFRHNSKLKLDEIVSLVAIKLKGRNALRSNVMHNLKRMVERQQLSVVDDVYTKVNLKFS